jgi:hypothetical protein
MSPAIDRKGDRRDVEQVAGIFKRYGEDRVEEDLLRRGCGGFCAPRLGGDDM